MLGTLNRPAQRAPSLWQDIQHPSFKVIHNQQGCVLTFRPADVATLNHIQRENLAHLLATMHLAIRQLDGEEKGPGQYSHLTNTTYEKFVER